ncbi:MAG: DUF1016 N-terminal domain-containing protein [Candidatus Omnitrophota bacterium]|nr:DUF1016 N-terminal domain-containing protein [Candidatus Omnitrophota bacterium]
MPEALAESLKSYNSLRQAVRQAIRLGRTRAEAAVEQEKVRTSWEVGRLILTHVLEHQGRGEYGEAVIRRLGHDLVISIRELQYMVEFARTYPNVRPAAHLSWSHYQALLRINDPNKRKALALEASQKGWTRKRLRSAIGRGKEAAGSAFTAHAMMVPTQPGKPGTYRILEAKAGPYKGQFVYDLGFSNYYRPARALRRPKAKPPEQDLFTYKAFVTAVIDGDTLWASIDLGFGFTTKQKLRLRALDAPELGSKPGRLAKNYLARKLKPATPVIIKTTKSDKFDRYLADIWHEGEHLNKTLVAKGYARVV